MQAKPMASSIHIPCSLKTDNKSRKFSKVKLPSLEKASQICCLNGFSRSSGSFSISVRGTTTLVVSPLVIDRGTIDGLISRNLLCTLNISFLVKNVQSLKHQYKYIL